ncbi:hypothetical protein Ahy_A07g032269 isoform B [Arachis hypogaea]|uniref:Uncharacterized protein n=1 Tax=Arachis hypogaea TaxID=3818 RepID=A0A445C6M6_ARAHY|nr:hypothetical protein Ahy_A07g032269 isoform B [Arachis hypogaea]
MRERRLRSERRECCEPGTMRGRRGAVALGRYQLRRILRRAIAAQTASVSFSHRRCRHRRVREGRRDRQREGKRVSPPRCPATTAASDRSPSHRSPYRHHCMWEEEMMLPILILLKSLIVIGIMNQRRKEAVIIVIVRRYRPCLELLNVFAARILLESLLLPRIGDKGDSCVKSYYCDIEKKARAGSDLSLTRMRLLKMRKLKARREEQIQAAHDKAMFGASALPPPTSTDSEPERENEKEVDKKAVVTSLLSETWRRR